MVWGRVENLWFKAKQRTRKSMVGIQVKNPWFKAKPQRTHKSMVGVQVEYPWFKVKQRIPKSMAEVRQKIHGSKKI